ncbi:hypothetical protein QE177_00410 [Arsenophonus sp. aPb]|uniref:hypothetical protein n=1 Tax=Arsenophonus sp. aPb TaxID=3041619 RepID=UPI0024685DCB|nr:hypothetical protein [Arsenophonus sp. aPb]WGL98418.1 hypothetical protein QE177_00410 [Arsenophonus sp. aPb]
MKKKKSVLIYGEYSGYGKSLVKGFLDLGYHSEVFSLFGDGFKKINGDFQLKGKSRFTKLFSLLMLIPKMLRFKNILIMNPAFFRFGLLGPFILFLFKITNKRIILLCCGDDVEFIKRGKLKQIENWPYIDIELPEQNYYSKKSDIFINNIIALCAYKIIPAMYDYRKAWILSKFADKVTVTIPLACDGEILPIREIKDKIVIMHGVNREGFKGTSIIRKAVDKIKKEYGNEVKIYYPERLPLDEYLKILEKADISIDQTKCNSYGMNAIYSMLSGHIVLAPANKYFCNDLNIKKCPVESISNNVDSIYLKLKELIDNRETLLQKKIDSQKYAIEMHTPVRVAEKISKYLI